jgi:hypothetical protein
MTSGSTLAMNSARWAKAVPLLSLDLVLPIYPMMGLSPRDPVKLQLVLREQLIRARPKLQLNPPTADRSVSATPNPLTTVDSDDARHVTQWVTHVFHADPADGGAIRAWSTLLRHCRRQPMLWDELLPDSRVAKEVLEAFERAISIDEFEVRYEELCSKPLSDWDLHLSALHMLDDDDLEGTPNGPYLWIAPTVRDFQGYRFWNWMRQYMSIDGLMRLRLHAENINQREAVLPDGSMPDPSLLAVDL